MLLIFEYFWVMFVLVTIANALVLKYRSRKYILANPDLNKGYRKYFKGIIIYGNIPWLIIAIGSLSGFTDNIFEYFKPKTLNPAVLVFHASIVVLWVVSVYWIYFNKGAEFIEAHPGLFKISGLKGSSDVTAKQVKCFFPLILLGGIGGMVMMWVTDFPIPNI